METSIQLTSQSYSSFANQDYKTCLVNLQKIKSSKTYNENSYFRLQNNILICEYLQNRQGNLQQFLMKLDQIISELADKANAKKAAPEDENNSQIDQENYQEDQFIIKYNFAVALFFAGNTLKCYQILKELFDNKESKRQFHMFKISFMLLDFSLKFNDFEMAVKVINYLDEQRKIKLNFQQSTTDVKNVEAKTTRQDSNSDVERSAQKEQGSEASQEFIYISSLIFGCEIFQHGKIQAINKNDVKEDNQSIINKNEYLFLLNCFKIQLLIQSKNIQKIKQFYKKTKVIYNQLQETLDYSINQDKKDQISKKQSTQYYFIQTAQFLKKQIFFQFKYIKSLMAYNERNYRKSIYVLSPAYQMEQNQSENNNMNYLYQTYQLNNIACCHLQMGKPKLAIYYLNKALNYSVKANIKQMSRHENITLLNINQQQYIILYNMGIAFYQSQKYQQAIEILSQQSSYFPQTQTMWYKLGISLIEQYHQILREKANQSENDIYQKILDPIDPQINLIVENPQKSSEEGRSLSYLKPDGKNEFQSYKRFVLHNFEKVQTSKEFAERNPEEEKETEINYQNPSNLLTMAIKCLRNCILQTKAKIEQEKKKKSLKIDLETENQEESKINENPENLQQISLDNEVENSDLLESAFVFLAYAFISTRDFNSTILTAQETLNIENLSEENRFKCINYLVEAYCAQGKTQEALNAMNNINFNNSKSQNSLYNCRNIFGINYSQFSDQIHNKTIIYTNFAVINIMNNNLQAAYNSINAALTNLGVSSNTMNANLPLPLLNVMIYYYLITNSPNYALQLIKRRRVLTILNNNNKPLFNITK